MQLTDEEYNALIALVKSWPGMRVLKITSEPGAIGRCIATSTAWPKAMKEEIFKRWPGFKDDLCVRRVKVIRNQ